MDNCCISRSNRGISLQLRDKGCIENIIFSNLSIETRMFSKMHWWGSAEPIAITALKRKESTQVGSIRNVRFQNINCSGENGILLYGDDSDNMEDIVFEHVKVQIKKTTDWKNFQHDLRPTVGDEFAEGTLSALYARHVVNVKLKECTFTVQENAKEYVGALTDIQDCRNFDKTDLTL